MINAAYKEELNNLAKYLEKLKLSLQDLDEEYQTIDQKKLYLNTIKDDIFTTIDNSMEKLWNIAEPLITTKEKHEEYKSFTRNMLISDLFNIGILNKRIYEKPLGYDGDYMVAHYFYLDDYLGNNLFEMLINKYTVSIPVTQAHINRKNYFHQYIKDLNTKQINILSIGSGPAIEVKEAIQANSFTGSIYFNDMETEAIQYIKDNLSESAQQHDIRLNFVHMNILQFIKNIPKLNLPQFDFIYSLGLFDYLKDKLATKVINAIYPLLKDDGIFLISNVADDIPNKINIEFLCDWNLIYRNSEQLTNLAITSNYSEKKTFKDNINGANVYLHLKK